MGDHDGRIDAEFAALPLRNLADAALDAARTLGADHADFRVERVRGQRIALSDGKLESLSDADDSGLAVRVIVDGTWGFAATVDLTPEAARDAARHAVEVAKVAAAMNTERIDLAPEPAYGDVTWVSAYEVDPFTVSPKEKADLLAGLVGGTARASRGQPRRRFGLPGERVQVLHRRVDHDDPAAGQAAPGADRDRGHRDRVRRHAHARAAGRPGLGVPRPGRAGTSPPSSPSCPSCSPPSSGPRRSRPTATTW